MKNALILLSPLIISIAFGQNIGIDVPDPSEKLEVGGVIYTNDGGIKFPDETIQTTAAFNTPFQASAEEYSFVLMVPPTGYPGGSVDTAGEVGYKVIDFNYRVYVPIDTSSGAVTGPPQHKVVRFAKEQDKISPVLFADLTNSNSLDKFEFYFLAPDDTGVLEAYYSITLLNCKVIEYSPAIKYMGGGAWAHVEEVAVVFQTIELEHILDSTFATDNW